MHCLCNNELLMLDKTSCSLLHYLFTFVNKPFIELSMHFVLPSISLFMQGCTNYAFFLSSPARCAIASPESTANDLEVGISPPVNNTTSHASAGLVTPSKTTIRKRRRQLYSPNKSALPHVLDHTRPSK